MKILIDFSQIPVQKAGVGVYALNLITKLYELDKINNYFIVVQDDDNSLDFIDGNNYKLIKIKAKFFRKLILRFFMEQFYLPYLTIKHKIDLVHSLHYSFPLLSPAKKLVTLCDMTFFKFPRSHVLIKRIYFRFFINLIPIFAYEIIAISKSSLDDFREIFPKWKNKGRVVYLGKSDSFRPNLNRERIEKIKGLFGITKEYLLFIGTIEPRKNIKNLVLAFHKLLNTGENYQLVIAGKKGWYYEEVFELINELGLKENVIFTGFMDEKDKPYLIAGAKIFIYPSIYEGFGIPVLEAIACGIPTITSNVSSLPEVSGDAALFAGPSDSVELCMCMKKLINDGALYQRLKQKSVEQAEKFTWDKTALGTLAVYNSL